MKNINDLNKKLHIFIKKAEGLDPMGQLKTYIDAIISLNDTFDPGNISIINLAIQMLEEKKKTAIQNQSENQPKRTKTISSIIDRMKKLSPALRAQMYYQFQDIVNGEDNERILRYYPNWTTNDFQYVIDHFKDIIRNEDSSDYSS